MNEEDAYTDMDKVVDLLGTLKLNCYMEDLEDCRSYINLIVDLKEGVAGNNPGFTMSSKNNGLRVHGDMDQCDQTDVLYSIKYDALMKVLPKALDYFLESQKKKAGFIKELMVNTEPRYLGSDDFYMSPAKLIDYAGKENIYKLIMDQHSYLSEVHGVPMPLCILDLLILYPGKLHVTMATNGRKYLDRTCDLGTIQAYTPVTDMLPYIAH